MHPCAAFTCVAVLLALLALPSPVMAGAVTIVNSCNFPIYYASVGQNQSANMAEIQGSYSEGYGANGDGISIKLSPTDDLSGPISQFEFTPSNNSIFWDMSNINGYPFSQGGMQIIPSMQNDPAYPTCIPVTCAAGQSTCISAYNTPDQHATMTCRIDSDLTLTMCPGDSGSGGNDGGNHIRGRRSVPAYVGLYRHQRFHSRHF